MKDKQPKQPLTPEPLDLINHLRQCSLAEFREELEQVQHYYPDKYTILVDFILSLKPKKPNGPKS